MTVRRAIEADTPWLLVQLRAFAQFFGTHRSLFPARDDHAVLLLGTLIDEHPFFIAEEAGHRMGFICGTLAGHPFNPEIRTLNEVFWWVDPHHRRGRAGLALLERFIEYGRKHADWVVMTLEAKSPVHPETLQKRGFHVHETTYLLEVR